MALILALKEGEIFYVDDRPVKVSKIISAHRFKLSVDKDWVTEEYLITSYSRVEVLPNVFCSAGSTPSVRQVRVLIEAPKNIKLLRDKCYDENNGQSP